LPKLYVYGYLNPVPSKPRLEREGAAQRQADVAEGELAPDQKTIANFGRDSGAAMQAIRAHFGVLCRQIGSSRR
jgi:transposase